MMPVLTETQRKMLLRASRHERGKAHVYKGGAGAAKGLQALGLGTYSPGEYGRGADFWISEAGRAEVRS